MSKTRRPSLVLARVEKIGLRLVSEFRGLPAPLQTALLALLAAVMIEQVSGAGRRGGARLTAPRSVLPDSVRRLPLGDKLQRLATIYPAALSAIDVIVTDVLERRWRHPSTPARGAA